MGGDTDMAGGGGDMGGGPKITMCPAAGAAPLASGTCEVTAGDGNKLITADVLLPGEVLRGGQVLVDESGRIACAACDCASATGAAGATRINCPTGVISPSFINTHDHIPYQTAPKPDSGERYEHRNDWRGPKRGHTGISSGGSTNTDGIRFAELRALMAGTTAVIGESNQSTPQGLLRNLDQNGANEGLGKPAVESDTFPLEAISSNSQIASGCAYPEQPDPTEIDNLDAYVIHVAEGIDAVSRNEFLCLSGNGTGSVDVVKDQTSMVHLIGLDAADYALLASKSTALVWSPRSNIRLYGNTAQVALADRVGVLITLGTDWVPSGSMNMLRELRCADELNSTYFDNHFSDEDLWKMATLNAAVALDMGDVIGSIKPGLFADLAIFDAATRRDHRAVIAAEPSDVVLVMRAGKILYGDAAVVTGARQGCETLDVCGRQKAACVMDETGKSLSAIQTAGANLYPLFFCPGQTIPNEPTCVPKRPAAVMGSTVYTGEVTSTDSDGDGIPDSDDNCPKTFNPIRPLDGGKQPDADSDGVGDACDPCPLQANAMTCAVTDPNDPDGDGVPTGSDNCPNVPNPMQENADNDATGDACDACPTEYNAPGAACVVSIYQIKAKTVAAGATVGVRNALVTGKGTSGVFLQVKEGDAGYMGPENSGIYVNQPTPLPNVGDRVDISSATVLDFFGQRQLSAARLTVTARGAAAPAPVTMLGGAPLTTADLASGAKAAALDGVLVSVTDVKVTDIAPAPGARDMAPTGEFVVTSTGAAAGVRVNDLLTTFTLPPLNDRYASVTGVLDYRNDAFKIEPRSAADLVPGAPALIAIGPNAFARTSGSPGPTIPTVMEVRLSRPATAPTNITLTSADPTKLEVVSPVTIPMGMTSAPIQVRGVAATAAGVGVTATLNGDTVMGTVRVLDGTETPVLTAIAPAAAKVVAGSTVQLTVTFDIPVAVDTQVMLSSTVSGTVPSSVTVLANQTSANFTYTQMGSGLTDTVTATHNNVMRTATITVGTPVVINEVDYDQVGTDTAEFVELYNGSSAPFDLSGYALVFVNGANDTEYMRVALSGTIPANGYLVVGAGGTIALPGAIQNDDEGIALIHVATGRVVDAMTYEGPITAATITGITPKVNLVEGTASTASDIGNGSVARCPNGADSDNAATDWKRAATSTPGAANSCN